MKAPPLHPVLNGGTFGMMSGEKPFYPAKVEATHENLVKVLKGMGLKHEQTNGRYGEPERSVIIHNPREDQMQTLGKLFGQESVVHSSGGKHKLIYTNGAHEGQHRTTVPAQPPHQFFSEPPEDYYTHLPNTGYYRINFDFDQKPQGTNMNHGTLTKALPAGAKLEPGGDSPANKQAAAEHAVMTDGLLEQGTERGVQPVLSGLLPRSAAQGIIGANQHNMIQEQEGGWMTPEGMYSHPQPVAPFRDTNEEFHPGDSVYDQQFWAHPNFYEWHDGHTDHHNPRPWDKQNAMETARSLGLVKSAQGDPKFDKQFNVFHETDHGSYRMSGGLHNRLQNPQSINLTYTSKQKSLLPGGRRPVSLGTFQNKHEAYAAQLAHHDRVAAGLHKALAKADNDQAAGVGVSTYAKFAAPYGSVTPGKASDLTHYDYSNKLPAVQDLVKKHGFQVYYAGGKYGKPDLANKNYNTGHLMIYDPTPASGGDFGNQDYTNAWRQIHELAHALTYPELNKTYGEGRRIGKLGTHRTLNEAQRAVHWEHLAAHKQRELSKQIGVHIPDNVFHKEYNTVMHDAVHRAVTGQFTEPSQEGFVPHEHEVPLSHALDMVRHEGKKMGLSGQHDTIKKPAAVVPNK